MDGLSDLADEVALRRGPVTPEAADAALRAVEAAERLLELDGALPNRRRLARALWRRLSTFAMPAERDGVERTALRCWSLCVEMLDAARGDAVLFDDVVGDVGMWAGMLVPALGSAGRHADAAQVYETAAIAAGQAYGARGRQARARLMVFPLAATADTMAEQRIKGLWDAAAEQALADTVTACHGVLDVLRGHLRDGVFEVAEVARTLQVLSRLQTVGGQLREAVAALDEAIALLGPVAGEGPRYAELIRALQAERDGFRRPPPAAPASRAADAPTVVPRRAFLRAARDVGMGADDLPPTDARAVVALERIRAAEAEDPGRYGPAHGLLMAWRARLLAESGETEPARDLADRSVRHLSRYADRPQQIQASLVVALAVLRGAASACGQAEQAARAGQRAEVLYKTLLARDVTYAHDLAGAT
ncbi:hypothetical protein [Streptomyces sp. NPDC091209]|uniref:hypothetical protein n=1 Tax=Streptomyces sp. NPDC091209 TaxID=3365974 RepID=UPI0037F61A16